MYFNLSSYMLSSLEFARIAILLRIPLLLLFFGISSPPHPHPHLAKFLEHFLGISV